MPGRPQKSIIKDPGETSGSHTSRVGRTMTCINCWQKGHNKATCKADPAPKPPAEKKPPSRNKQSAVGYCASRGRGRGRGGSENKASGNEEQCRRRRGGGRGNRAVGSTRDGMDGSSSMGLLTSEERSSLEEAPFNHTYAEVLIRSIHSQPTQQSGVWVKDTTDVTTEYVDEFPGMETSETTNVAEGIGSAVEEELPAPAVDKGK
ncbi:hypothetical protein Tco_0586004 [Tanacetum coccineum]